MKRFFLFVTALFFSIVTIKADNVDFVANKVCLGSYTTLVGTSVYPDSLIASYRWDLDNNGIYNDAIGKSINYLFSLADTFQVRVKIVMKDGGEYLMTSPKDVVVHPLPNANFTAENVCQGQSVLFNSTSAISNGSIDQYLWDFNNDGITDNTAGSQVSYNYGNSGLYTTRLEIISDKGCHALTTKSVQIFPKPAAAFSVQNACAGADAIFTNQTNIQADNILYYYWNYGDNEIETTSGNSAHKYSNPGTYNVKLIAVSSHYCNDTAQNTVNVYYPQPVEIYINGDSVIYPGFETHLEASGIFVSALWSNGATGNNIQVNQAGNYSVEVTDNNGCKSSDSVTISLKYLNSQMIKSDVITPNGDGINDFLVVEDLIFFSPCKIKIFDMWGDKIHETENYQNDWDGGNVPAGAYYYVITTNNFEIIGCVNLLK